MDISVAFRIFLMATTILSFLVFFLAARKNRGLPAPLAQYVATKNEPPFDKKTTVVGTALAILVFLSVGIAVALFFYWSPARHLYLIVTLASLLLSLFNPPSVFTALENTLISFLNMLNGATLVIIYFSPVAGLFI